ncbi:MAG: hypothetical protein ABI619_02035 [Betaproteobacteria bacterium]
MSDNVTSADLGQLSHGLFLELLNSKFSIKGFTAEPIELELIEVSKLQQSRRQEAFSIQFRGPASPLLAQRCYPLEHPKLGSSELFLVPIGQDSQGVYYEAVFNRLIPST